MSQEANVTPDSILAGDEPFINDAITSDDAGYVGNAGEAQLNEEGSEAQEEAVEVQAETEQELKDEIEQAVEDGATKEQVQDMIKEFVLKVNGKEVKKKINLSDEEAIKRELQLALAGRESMQKYAELERALSNDINNLFQEDTFFDTLKNLGLDDEYLDTLSEKRLRNKVEELKKSPDQIEKERMQKELAEARKELEEQKRLQEEARLSKLQEEEGYKLENEIMEALDSHQTLPYTQGVVNRIADTMLWAMDEEAKKPANERSEISVKDVLPIVEQEYEKEIQDLFNSLPVDFIEKYIGKKNMERYRESRLKRSSAPPNIKNIKATSKSTEPQETKEMKKVKMNDYFRNLK